MTEKKTCPTCGAPLPSDATGGACPKCLLQAGFATGGSSPPAGGHVPTPEELAPRFPGLVIEDLLGRGGMGVVYRARHKALDREVALKVLPERVAADRAFADRFQREARALAKLQHPNIVAVHDFGVTDGLFWLVMEYVDGANIRQAMRAGQIGPKEALAIVPQICDALQYAHEHGVVHRDIKPENVLLDKAGHVKVADFGLAKLMEHDAADLTLTGAGQVMGTPHYMAPEQWEKPTTVDHRADIYSLGVVFYEMLTGELPVGRFAAPSKKSDVDARIDEIVLRTLEREREARYQQVSQVKTDVGALSASAAAPCGAPLTAEETAHRRRMSRVMVAASLVCAALVFVLTWRGAPDGVRNVAGMLAIPVGITLIAAAWSQRRGRRSAAPTRRVPWGWWAALAALLLCGGPLTLVALTFVGAPPSLVVSHAQDGEIRALLSALQQHPGPVGKWYREFYDGESQSRLNGMSDAERERIGAGGAYGFPLMSDAARGGKLEEFELESVAIADGGPELMVSLKHKSSGVHVGFRMTYLGGSLKFTSGPAWVR